MSKSKRGFDYDFIYKIPDINNDVDHFLQESQQYLSSSAGDVEPAKISRLLDLLRFSDALINDQGEVNQAGLHLLESLCIELVDSENKAKARHMFKQIVLIHKLRSLIVPGENDVMTKNRAYSLLASFMHQIYIKNEQYLKKLRHEPNQKDFERLQLSKSQVYENVCVQVSSLIKYLQTHGGLDTRVLLSLSNISNTESEPLDSYTSPIYNDIVADWKYLNATITKDGETGAIIASSDTDPALSYAMNRLIDQASRDSLSSSSPAFIHDRYSSEIDISYWVAITTIYGLNELMRMPDIPNIVAILKSSLSLRKRYEELKERVSWLDEDLQEISVDKWILFLAGLQVRACRLPFMPHGRMQTGFVKVELDTRKFKPQEIDVFVNALTISAEHGGDVLDQPIVARIDKNTILVFEPAMQTFDPIFVIRGIMMRDSIWQNETGHNFESAVKSWLDEGGYITSKMDVKSDKSGKYELDGFVLGTDGSPLLLELKTFVAPHSQREYRFQVDKLQSYQYLKHAKKNLAFFAQKYIDTKGNHQYPVRKLFVSNLVFDKQQYIDDNFGFAQLYQLYRVIQEAGTDTLKSKINDERIAPLFDDIGSSFDFVGGITTKNVDKIINDKYFRKIFNAPMGEFREEKTAGKIAKTFSKSNGYLTLNKFVGDGWVRISYA